MLLLLPQGTAGFTPIGTTDTAQIQASEGNTSDFDIQTLDFASLSLDDDSSQGSVTTLNRSEFAGLFLVDVVSLNITTGLVAKLAGQGGNFGLPLLFRQPGNPETANLSILDVASVLKDPALITPTDTASISVTDAGAVAELIAVTDDADIEVVDASTLITSGAETKAVSDDADIEVVDAGSVADLITVSDTASLTLTDAGTIAASGVVSINVTDSATLVLSAEVGAVAVPRFASDIANYQLVEVAVVAIDGLVTRAVTESATVALTEVAVAAVTLAVTDTASIDADDSGSLFIDPGLITANEVFNLSLAETAVVGYSIDVTDTFDYSAGDESLLTVAADVAIDPVDLARIFIEDRARVVAFGLIDEIRFSTDTDAIRFQAQ